MNFFFLVWNVNGVMLAIKLTINFDACIGYAIKQ